MVRMKRGGGRSAVGVLAFGLFTLVLGASPSRADTFQGVDLDIAYWAGTGVNEAVMIVDFLATGGDSYAFGYRWDNEATGYDMVQAVADAGTLDFTATDYGSMGVYMDNFFYNAEAGDPANYWAYWVGTADNGDVVWSQPSVGMTSRPLSDGDFDGWYNGFDGTQPRVPEPATVLLLSTSVLFWRRHGRSWGLKRQGA